MVLKLQLCQNHLQGLWTQTAGSHPWTSWLRRFGAGGGGRLTFCIPNMFPQDADTDSLGSHLENYLLFKGPQLLHSGRNASLYSIPFLQWTKSQQWSNVLVCYPEGGSRRAASKSHGSLLEMQNLRPHCRSAEWGSVFYLKLPVTCLHSKVLEALHVEIVKGC